MLRTGRLAVRGGSRCRTAAGSGRAPGRRSDCSAPCQTPASHCRGHLTWVRKRPRVRLPAQGSPARPQAPRPVGRGRRRDHAENTLGPCITYIRRPLTGGMLVQLNIATTRLQSLAMGTGTGRAGFALSVSSGHFRRILPGRAYLSSDEIAETAFWSCSRHAETGRIPDWSIIPV
jgi:hypothetical protein